jgi:hypothetical protein
LRATVALLRGDVAGSLHAHPLAVVAVPTAVYAVVRSLSSTARTKTSERAFSVLVAGVVAAMFVVWVLRFQGALGGASPVNSIWSRGLAENPVAKELVPSRSR